MKCFVYITTIESYTYKINKPVCDLTYDGFS